MKKSYKPIPEGEWIVLEILWKNNRPMQSTEIVSEYQQINPVQPQAVRTIIKRLMQREVIAASLKDKTTTILYSPTISEDKLRARESDWFVNTYFNGKSERLFASLVKSEKLSENKVISMLEELKKE